MPQRTKTNFKFNLIYLRHRKGKTQEDVSDDMDITKSRIGSYEEGRSEAPYWLLAQFAEYYGVTTDILITQDLYKRASSPLANV